jgi:hypothetical protein
MKETISVIILLIAYSQLLSSQTIPHPVESTTRPESLMEAFNLHFPDQHVKKIHGRPYHNPYPRITEHQFFKTRTPVAGVIVTLTDTIHSSYIMYDLSRDKIIVYESAASAFIELEEEFIRQFRLFADDANIVYEFVIPEPENDTSAVRWTGFHQVLFRGRNTELYKKHLRTYAESIENKVSVVRFTKKERLLLRKGGKYYWIKRNRDLLRIYPEVKSDIRRFLRSSGIYIQRAGDDQIRATGQYLDELQPPYATRGPG